MSEPSDEVLVDAIVRRRSETAARQLVDRHSPRLLATARRVLGSDVPTAEDVLQRSWIKAVESLSLFRGDAEFTTWITRIVIRTAIDHLRARQAHELTSIDAELTLAAVHGVPVDCDEQIDIERAVSRLPAGCRAVLVAHDIEGFTHEEIAATLGIAVGTSKAHLFRARRLLRAALSHSIANEATS